MTLVVYIGSAVRLTALDFFDRAARSRRSFCLQIYTPAEQGISEKYGVSQTVGILGLTLFILGYGTGPSEWAALHVASLPRRFQGIANIFADLSFAPRSDLLATARNAASRSQPGLLGWTVPLHHLPDPDRPTEEPHVPPHLSILDRLCWFAYPRHRRRVDGRHLPAQQAPIRDGSVVCRSCTRADTWTCCRRFPGNARRVALADLRAHLDVGFRPPGLCKSGQSSRPAPAEKDSSTALQPNIGMDLRRIGS